VVGFDVEKKLVLLLVVMGDGAYSRGHPRLRTCFCVGDKAYGLFWWRGKEHVRSFVLYGAMGLLGMEEKENVWPCAAGWATKTYGAVV
jgi:hypothetical protein